MGDMGVLSIILLVIFIIVSVLLVLIVLVQNDEGDTLGGIFAGGGGSAFGSRAGNMLTHATAVLGAAFLVLSFLLALSNRTPAGQGVTKAGQESNQTTSSNWWQGNAGSGSANAKGAANSNTTGSSSAGSTSK